MRGFLERKRLDIASMMAETGTKTCWEISPRAGQKTNWIAVKRKEKE